MGSFSEYHQNSPASHYQPLPTLEDDEDSHQEESRILCFRQVSSKNRDNHLFCGCCCDVRRATIVLNLIVILLEIWMVILAFAWSEVYEKEHYSQLLKTPSDDNMTTLVVLVVPVLLLHICGVYGALKFKVWAVKLSAMTLVIIPFVLNAFTTIDIICTTAVNFVCVFVMYPHLILIKEMEAGIMTDYNYEKVRACCLV